MTVITPARAKRILALAVRRAGGAASFARVHGFDRSSVAHSLRGALRPVVARAAGLARKTVWVRSTKETP